MLEGLQDACSAEDLGTEASLVCAQSQNPSDQLFDCNVAEPQGGRTVPAPVWQQIVIDAPNSQARIPETHRDARSQDRLNREGLRRDEETTRVKKNGGTRSRRGERLLVARLRGHRALRRIHRIAGRGHLKWSPESGARRAACRTAHLRPVWRGARTVPRRTP